MKQKKLTEAQQQVLYHAATEPAFSGALLHETDDGSYLCAGCDALLFTSNAKFDSHCGWPSFDSAIKNSVAEKPDFSHGMVRTEIVCAQCGGHLGHVFDDGPTETTGLRYCVNSLSLDFVDKNGNRKSGAHSA